MGQEVGVGPAPAASLTREAAVPGPPYAGNGAGVDDLATSAAAVAFAQRAAQGLLSLDQDEWLVRVDGQRERLYAVMDQAIAAHDATTAAALADALWRYWSLRGRANEGLQWMERVLALGQEFRIVAPVNDHTDPPASGGDAGLPVSAPLTLRDTRAPLDPAWRARLLGGAGDLAYQVGDYVKTRTFAEESLAIWRALDVPLGVATALHSLGDCCLRLQEFRAAQMLHEKGLSIRRRLGDAWGEVHSVAALARLARIQGDRTTARRLRLESVRLKAALGGCS